MFVQNIIQWIVDLPKNLIPFTEWLWTPIAQLNNIAPIALLGIGGFVVVFVLHVAHLVNPVG